MTGDTGTESDENVLSFQSLQQQDLQHSSYSMQPKHIITAT